MLKTEKSDQFLKSTPEKRRRFAFYDVFEKSSLIKNRLSIFDNKIAPTMIEKQKDAIIKVNSIKKKFKDFFKSKKNDDNIQKERPKFGFLKVPKKLNLLQINIELNEFIDIFFIFSDLNKNNDFFSMKDFVKMYIVKNQIQNKKFRYLFLNQNFILNNREKLKYLCYSFIFFQMCDVNIINNEDNDINITDFNRKNFDKLFYKEIKSFLNFLKNKLTNIQDKKMKNFKSTFKNLNLSIKKRINGKNEKILNEKMKNLSIGNGEKFEKNENFKKKISVSLQKKAEVVLPILKKISFRKKRIKMILDYNQQLNKFLCKRKPDFDFILNYNLKTFDKGKTSFDNF